MNIDDRLSVVALVDGEPMLRSAIVVRRDHQVVHVSTAEPFALAIGDVVALCGHVGTPTDAVGTSEGLGSFPVGASLALVAESVGPTVTAFRLLERRG